MSKNPLIVLGEMGQSIWLDYIRRSMTRSGELEKLIREAGLRGVTSNPKIFEKAITGSHDYAGDIESMAGRGLGPERIYEAVAVADVQEAADLFRRVYESTGGRDGFVSLEVSPELAFDAEATVSEARRLWAALDRPNVLIKVPGTEQGLGAIRQLISEGINVNVTLLFGLPRYRAVADAYITGLEELAATGKDISTVASVASFFLSRIDVLVDPLLEEKMSGGGPAGELARSAHGQVAIASARIAYQMYKDTFGEERFRRLAARGAATQRLLWASTSTKNPAYSDVKYVDALIGPDTVNTVPLETLSAYRDHGNPAPRIEKELDAARSTLDSLETLGIDLAEVTKQLVEEGVEKFRKPFRQLLDSIHRESRQASHKISDRQEISLGGLGRNVERRTGSLKRAGFITRLWSRDATLWKEDPSERVSILGGLGWLHVAEKMEETLGGLQSFAERALDEGFRHVVHMGMGGSSLAPLVFQRTLGQGKKGMPLTVLDSTDPGTILRLERSIPMEKSLFIVASKSGTTAEPLAFMEYFFDRLKEIRGDDAGRSFVAVTDPGRPLLKQAEERGFRKVFTNFTDIGGRYSALSYFGLLPAVLYGVDVEALLDAAVRMAHACASSVPLERNPGVVLGTVMGEAALAGRDKVTFLMPEKVGTFGMWLEQLLAESTGKEGKGLLPVAGERPGSDPGVYGSDRLFIHYRIDGMPDEALETAVSALKEANHPVVTIRMRNLLDLGEEFFRWEIATATSGSILGINTFDQPNVQESKDNTNRLLQTVRDGGELAEETPAVRSGPLAFFGREESTPPAAKAGNSGDVDAVDYLRSFFERTSEGDYVALQAYLTEEPDTENALQAIRHLLRDRLRLATTLGYGPRFLHSTGQYHKGGPNTGLFLQLTAEDSQDVAVPGQPYSFGTFKKAQALGDLEALRAHGRRVIRIHLGPDVRQGLQALRTMINRAVDERR